MTIEEIKNTPKIVDYLLDESVIVNSRKKLHKRMDEICNLAIKALEQEPCEDAISRAQAIQVASGYCHPANIAKELAKLPSVKPVKSCDNCEVGNPCLYCKHEYEPHESEVEG